MISQILLCKQITPDFNQEELCSIAKDSQEIAKLLSDMKEHVPNQESYLGKMGHKSRFSLSYFFSRDRQFSLVLFLWFLLKLFVFVIFFYIQLSLRHCSFSLCVSFTGCFWWPSVALRLLMYNLVERHKQTHTYTLHTLHIGLFALAFMCCVSSAFVSSLVQFCIVFGF